MGDKGGKKDKAKNDKQKTAYEIRLSLVGSEMCIRDRLQTGQQGRFPAAGARDLTGGVVAILALRRSGVSALVLSLASIAFQWVRRSA